MAECPVCRKNDNHIIRYCDSCLTEGTRIFLTISEIALIDQLRHNTNLAIRTKAVIEGIAKKIEKELDRKSGNHE